MRFLRNLSEPRILAFAATIGAGLWLFIAIADKVVEGDTGTFDRAVMFALQTPGNPPSPLGPPWVQSLARDVTALGSATVLGLVVTAVTIFLLLGARYRTALFLLLSTSGGTLTTLLLKQFFDRTRPAVLPHGDYVVSASFPSGHAMLSAVVYLTVAALIAQLLTSRVLRVYLILVALVLSTMIGVSRVYLGVHWPTDVLAGWVAGATWALLCWLIARRFQRGVN